MRIVKNNICRPFSEVPFGGVFEYDDTFYIKIVPVSDDADILLCNAISLVSGNQEIFDCNDDVIYRSNATLTFE